VRRADLEHIIRAASRIVEQDIVVIGSQALLAQHPNPPAAMARSNEADVYPRNTPERAIEIDGAIGEESQFHATFDYYAHGVGPETAKAPDGWRERLIPLVNENTDGATGWCMEIHDLVLSKCFAGREKDWAYARIALDEGLVDPALLLERTSLLPGPKGHREQIAQGIRGLASSREL
jgi:hypothetical protein